MSQRHRNPTVKRARSVTEVPDFTVDRGPAVTPLQLAEFIGLSHRFVLQDIRMKELKAKNVGRGDRPVYIIAFAEAKRYVKELGAL